MSFEPFGNYDNWRRNPMNTEAINITLDDVETEVCKQLNLWGTDFDDKNTANDWVAYICHYVASGAYDGRQEKYDPEKFQEHLKKAAALCVSAVVAIARNGDCAPRHYENKPNAGATSNQ